MKFKVFPNISSLSFGFLKDLVNVIDDRDIKAFFIVSFAIFLRSLNLELFIKLDRFFISFMMLFMFFEFIESVRLSVIIFKSVFSMFSFNFWMLLFIVFIMSLSSFNFGS